jgi:hypothetical protein
MTSTLDLRRQLLANGYTPLPNVGKACFMKQWPSLVVDEGALATWDRRHKRFADTGLRVENGLAVIDLDINHEVIEHVAAAIEDRFPALLDGLVRYGKGSKEAWFVRTDEPFTRLHTRRWLAPGADLERDGAQVVEIFGGSSPRQFGAFGAHTRGDDGSVVVAYEWAADQSPATVRLSDLPELTKADFIAIVDLAEAVLQQHGFTPVLRSVKGESEATRAFDLTEEHRFECNDAVTRTLDELAAVAGTEGLRCSASWLEPGAGHSLTRCLVGLTHGGQLTVWDAATGVTHMRADLAPVEHEQRQADAEAIAVRLRRLAEQEDERKTRRRAKLSIEDKGVLAAAKVSQSYAYNPTSPQQAVVPIWARELTDGMSMTAFRQLMLPHCDVEIGPKGGEKKINPADIWMASSTREVVAGLRMRPDKPRPLFEEDGRRFVNVYTPPVHDTPPEGREVWEEFMAHLLPDPVERSWFLDWLAHKHRFPAVPGPGVVMVARRQGAGRGTLFAMVRQLLGPSYVRKVDPVTLTGEGGQSQYNTWLSSSTMVLIDELFNAGTGAHLWQRKKAYDRIKALIDPSAREVEIIQKTINNYVTLTFTSFLMATNNLNALPLDQDDRRICVLSNNQHVVLAERPALSRRLEAVRDGSGGFQPGFISAIVEALDERDLSDFSAFAPPPMFDGKINMILQNQTDVGEVADQALEELPGDFVTRDAFVERVRTVLGAKAADYKNLVPEARDRIDRSTWIFLGRVKVRENGSKADVWARDVAAHHKWNHTPLAERWGLLEANNDPRRKMSDAQMRALAAGLRTIEGGGQ